MCNRFVTKPRLVAVSALLIIIISVIYYKCYYIDHTSGISEWSGDHCFAELTSVKLQLGVVTEYKEKVDKLLAETEKQYKLDKERYQEILESCFAVKQQALTCQSHYEDLQSEFLRLKGDFDKLRANCTEKQPTRPIDANHYLPCIDKIFGRYLGDEINKFLNNNNNQFDAIWFPKTQKYNAIVIAFDCLNFITICKKLEQNGIQGPLLEWFKSYYNNRITKVRIDDSYSDIIPTTKGTAQGSIIGPTEYIIYVNDMCNLFREENMMGPSSGLKKNRNIP